MFEVTLLLEFMALITGVIFFKKITPVILLVLLPLLMITVINESISHYVGYNSIGVNKYFAYSLYFYLFFSVFSLIYHNVLSFSIKKSLLFYLISTFLALYFFFIQGNKQKLNLNYLTFICLGLLYYGFAYLYKLYKSGKVLSLKKNPVFFISVGVVISQFLLLLFTNALRIEGFKNEPNTLFIFQLFNTLGNMFFYLSIIYSFICTSIYPRRAGI